MCTPSSVRAAISTGPKTSRSTNTTAASTSTRPDLVVFPRTTEEVAAHRQTGARIRRADRRPRRGHGAFRRRDSARGRHHDRLRAHEPHPRNRSGKRARRGAAGRGQSRYHAGGGGAAAISTRPIPPASAPAPSAATWRRTPAARTRWPTASPPITCWGSKWCCPMARVVETGGKELRPAGLRSHRPADRLGRHHGAGDEDHRAADAQAGAGQDDPGDLRIAARMPADTVAEITARAITPVAVEMLDGVMLRMVEEATHAGYPHGRRGGAADRTGRACARRWRSRWSRFARPARVCGAREFRVARTAEERDLLWKGRKNAFGAVGRVSPTYYVQDGVVPRTKIAPTLHFIGEVAREVRPDHQQHLPRRRRQHAPHHPVRSAQARRPGEGASGRRRDSRATASTWAARSPASTASAWRRTS